MRSKPRSSLETIAAGLRPQKQSSNSEQKARIPSTYTAFAEWCGVRLSTGQRALTRIAYDGAGLDDLQPSERDAAIQIFGPIDTVPLAARSVVGAVCGGRGGKTYTLVALRMVFGLLVRDLSSLAPGQRAVSLVVAPNDKLRQEAVNYALGVMRSRPELSKLLVLPRGTRDEDTPSEFGVKRPDGKLVMFEAGVATRGGYGGRGRSLTDFAMDESAFFRDASYKVNDVDIFQAASSRVLPGGQTIVASTPWAESGLLYDLWSRNFGKPSDALVAHAPTMLLNPTDWARTIVERERLRDPDNAAREFDAKFMAGGTTVFFEASAIQAAIDSSLDNGRVARPGETVAAGADFGFRSDSSALAIAQRDGQLVYVGDLLELRPERGSPLKPSETVARFAERLRQNGCTYLMADGHYRETINEHLAERDLAYCPAPSVPAEAYVRARVLFREGRVKIPNNPRLLQQLREVQGRPLPGGGLSITQPRWRTGGHGDLVSALVLALHQLGGDEVAAQEAPEGTREHEEALREARRANAEAVAKRSQWERRDTNPFRSR